MDHPDPAVTSPPCRMEPHGPSPLETAVPRPSPPELRARLASLSAEQRAALRTRLASGSKAGQPPSDTHSDLEPGMKPASFAQEALWFLHQLDPSDRSYHRPTAWRLRGALHHRSLEAAVQEMVRRHEALRTTLHPGSEHPWQKVSPHHPVFLPLEPLPPHHAAEPEAWFLEVLRQEMDLAFDLAAGPLFRGRLLQLAPGEHVLLLIFHHAVFDAWSASVASDELAAHYTAFLEGRAPSLAPLPLQYGDFAAAQRRRVSSPALRRQLAQAVRHLQDHPGILGLPLDRPRPAVRRSRGAARHHRFSSSRSRQLHAFCQAEGVTLFMALATVTGTLLHRYSGDAEVLVGVPTAGRLQVEAERLIGCLIGTLVLRLDFRGAPSGRALLQRTREEMLRAYAGQEIPFERLVAHLQPARDLSRTPLFQVMVQLRNQPPPTTPWPGLEASLIPLPASTARTDLEFVFTETGEELHLECLYATDLFETETIDRLLTHHETLLNALLEDPERAVTHLPLLTPAERRQQFHDWNHTASVYPRDQCLHKWVAARTRSSPEAVAIVFEEECLTYRELEERALRLVGPLRAAGVGPDTLVGILLPRSPDLVAAVLGVLHAGGAYLPLDPRHPPDRLAQVWCESRATTLVTCTLLRELAPPDARVVLDFDRLPEVPVPAPDRGPVRAEHLAYVLFTSGSTGVPKGVAVEHRAVVNFLHAMLRSPGLSAKDVVLGLTTLGFDIAVLELFLPLVCGARVVLAPETAAQDPEALGHLIERHAITMVQATPATWRLLQAAGWPGNRRVRALCGGEPLPPDLAAWMLPRCAELWNLYGPTETTVYSVTALIRSPEDIPIGRPIANTRVYVVDAQLQPVPAGFPGELLIGGDGLAREYLHRPDLTASRFLPDPFHPGPGSRVYRTGDLARFRQDGSLQHLGRLDRQVKIHGFRIELEEIEFQLAAHPGVGQAAVIATGEASTGPELRAFVTPAAGCPHPAAEDLRAHLASRLPPYMVPGSFAILDRMPLSPTGKIHHLALAGLRDSVPPPGVGSIPARTPLERAIGEAWSTVLKRGPVGVHDNFFHLGGHSLLAVQLVARLRTRLGREIPVRAVFDHPTIAAFVDGFLTSGVRTPPPIPALPVTRPRTSRVPLSFAQQRLWFLHQLEGDTSAYHIPGVLRLRGPLRIEVLQRALQVLADRHESLRTRCVDLQGSPIQIVEPPLPLPLELHDFSDLDPGARSEALQRWLSEDFRRPFDPAVAPLFRVALLRLAPDDHLLCRTFHHLIADGWSLGVFHRELSELYSAFLDHQPNPLPALPAQYADFTLWQHAWLQGDTLQRQVDFWRAATLGAPALELPLDRPRPEQGTSAGGSIEVPIPESTLGHITELERREEATAFMILLAAFQVLLARHSGQEDFLVGTPIANRRLQEFESILGLFANTLALRANLAGNPSFRELLARTRTATLQAFDHQDLPFERLVEELNPRRDPSRHPLFQVLFVLQNTPSVPLALPGLEVREHPLPSGTTHVDLELHVLPAPEGWVAHWRFSTELFDPQSIQRMAARFITLLDALLTDPEESVFRVQWLPPAEQQILLEDWNPRSTELPPPRGIHEIFAEQARLHPSSIALESGDTTVSYEELNRRANRLAAVLQAQGVAPGQTVAVCAERSVETIIAWLAILKAGAAYLPLDPQLPAHRLGVLLEDAQPSLILSQSAFHHRIPATATRILDLESSAACATPQTEPRPVPLLGPDALAYVMYTSGTTGQPKGVMIPHRGVTRLVTLPGDIHLDASEVLLQFAPLSFDASTFEVWAALLNGARLVIAPPGPLGLEELGTLLTRHKITTLWLTAPLFHQVIENAPGILTGVRQVVSGGDVLRPDAVARFFEHHPASTLINGYGPTENTTFTTCHRMQRPPPAGTSVPIGRPVPGTCVRLLDPHRQLVPPGVPGELFTGGAGLAHGYLRRPELDAERFIPDPFAPSPGSRLYRTGDRARHLPDGTIEFLGRLDQQVKIRGFRVEPAEIEVHLAAHPAVAEAAVVPTSGNTGETELRAFVAPTRCDLPPEPTELRRHLAQHLPGFMVPTLFTVLGNLPLSHSGKLDRTALARMAIPSPGPNSQPHTPASPLEQSLARLWSEHLPGRPSLIPDSDFFEHGGHSLLALRVLSRMRSELGLDVTLSQFFRHPTIAGLAALAGADGAAAEDHPRPPRMLGLTSGIPLFLLPGQFGLAAFPPDLVAALRDTAPFSDRLRYAGVEDDHPPHTSLEAIAAHVLPQIESLHPHPAGPLCLAGFSFGGLVAFEVAQRLRRAGRCVPLLILFDTLLPRRFRRRSVGQVIREVLRRTWRLPPGQRLPVLSGLLRSRWPRAFTPNDSAPRPGPNPRHAAPEVAQSGLLKEEVRVACAQASREYQPTPYPGRVVLFKATVTAPHEWIRRELPTHNGWADLITGPLEIIHLPCDHLGVFTHPLPAQVLERTVSLMREVQEQRQHPGRLGPPLAASQTASKHNAASHSSPIPNG